MIHNWFVCKFASRKTRYKVSAFLNCGFFYFLHHRAKIKKEETFSNFLLLGWLTLAFQKKGCKGDLEVNSNKPHRSNMYCDDYKQVYYGDRNRKQKFENGYSTLVGKIFHADIVFF